MGEFSAFLATLNDILWHEYVLHAIVGTGIPFTICCRDATSSASRPPEKLCSQRGARAA
jgi:Na+/alanine symporter